jgi:hypothetical protein
MISRSRTTFILGAGASFHAGYPFVRTMGADLLAWMRLPRQSVCYDFAQSADFLEERFGNHIEDLFNGVQAEIQARQPNYAIFANVHKPCLIEAMRQWFGEIHLNHAAQSYDLFASEIVQPGDRIITFNYDAALDSRLCKLGKWAVGDGYGFAAEGLPHGSSVKMFKLHGSINWLAVMFRGMTGGPFAFPMGGAFGSRPAFTDFDLSALGYTDLIDPLFPRTGTAAVPPLILPTSRKQFFFATNLGREWRSFWDRLWRGARRAVQTSNRIVMCGYGMYPIDRRGCNLLLRGNVSAEIEVCCGSESARIAQQLREGGRNARVAERTYFEEWVSSRTSV